MLIRSNFKDCYDSVQALGSDHGVVYERNTIRCSERGDYEIRYPHKILSKEKSLEKIPSLNILLNICYNKNKDVVMSKQRGWLETREMFREVCLVNKKTNDKYRFYKGLFFFCGKIYNLVTVEKDFTTFNKNESTKFFYDKERLQKYIESKEIVSDGYFPEKGGELRNKLEKCLFDWFKEPDESFKEQLIINKVISVFFSFGSSKVTDIVINPRLTDIDFITVLEPSSIFQELDIYISGTLTYPQNSMVEVSNEQKVIKHGFDPKYGFRKRKT